MSAAAAAATRLRDGAAALRVYRSRHLRPAAEAAAAAMAQAAGLVADARWMAAEQEAAVAAVTATDTSDAAMADWGDAEAWEGGDDDDEAPAGEVDEDEVE